MAEFGLVYGGSCEIALNSTTRRHPRLGLVLGSRGPTQVLENGRPSSASPSLPDSARNRPECYRISTTTERTARRQVQKKELRQSQRRTQRNCPQRTIQIHPHFRSLHHSPRPATSERHHRRPEHKRPPSVGGGARAATATRGVSECASAPQPPPLLLVSLGRPSRLRRGTRALAWPSAPSTVRPWARGFCPHGRPGPLGFGLCGRFLFFVEGTLLPGG